jgi:hypothetical protein
MQNQNPQTNKPKGFFGRGLDAFAKMKDSLTGETQKQATKERDDLLRYLDFGGKMGIVDDKERAVHEAKIKSLESKMSENKIDGIATLQSLAGKGKDIFANAKSMDWKTLAGKGIATAFGLGIAASPFLSNPAMAANIPANNVHESNPANIEGESFKIPVINSIEDAVRLNGTVNQGMTVMLNGRKVKIVGDGSKAAEAKGVNLVDSYKFATEKFKSAPALDQRLPNIKPTPTTVSPSSTQEKPVDEFNIPAIKPKNSILDRIFRPKQTPVLSIPTPPLQDKVTEQVPVYIPKAVEETPKKVTPVQQTEIKLTRPPAPTSIKKDSVIFVPPVIADPATKDSKIKIDTGVFGLPTKPTQDPFVISPTKPASPLDTILKQKIESAPLAPIIVAPEIKIDKPTGPVEVEKKPETKVVTPPKVNPNPNIPFVMPPLPPKPNLENYKPKTPEVKVSPAAQPAQVTTPVDNTRERLDVIRSGDIKPGEFFQRGEVRDAQSVLDGVNANRSISRPTPDQQQSVLGGARQNGKELFVEGNVGFSFGEPPAEVVSKVTRVRNLKAYINEAEIRNAELASEMRRLQAENNRLNTQATPISIIEPISKPADKPTALNK